MEPKDPTGRLLVQAPHLSLFHTQYNPRSRNDRALLSLLFRQLRGRFDLPSIGSSLLGPRPQKRLLRRNGATLARLGQPRRISDSLPINSLPPSLGESLLPADAAGTDTVIPKPDVFPGVEAQERGELDATGGKLVLLLRHALDLGILEPGAAGAVLARGVHVGVLAAPVGGGVRRSGEVGGEDGEVGRGGLDEPDEAGAEHCRGGGDEFAAEGLDAAEGAFEVAAEVGGHGVRVGGEVLEEEVVVVGHGGVVEDGGLGGLAGRGDEGGVGVLLLKFGAWNGCLR